MKHITLYVGIDPGSTTTICHKTEKSKPIFYELEFDPFPDRESLINGMALKAQNIIYILERQWIRPGQGTRNAAYDAYLQILTIIEMSDRFFSDNVLWTPAPIEWKSYLEMESGSCQAERKQISISLAEQTFGQPFANHNAAEAALLTHYGVLKHGEIAKQARNS